MGTWKWMVAAALALSVLGCESKADKCKKVCDDVVAKEHGADSKAVEDCKALCDEAAK